MADKSFEWAKARGLHRISEVHGAEEADIPLDMSWTKTATSGARVGFTSTFTMEAEWVQQIQPCAHIPWEPSHLCLLNQDPDGSLLSQENEDLAKPVCGASSSGDAAATAQAGASFKILG